MTDGQYESEVESRPELITDQTCKRLLSAMQYGIVITHAHGHRWIYSFETEGGSIDDALHEKGKPKMRSKCYGSVLDALNRVDGALKILGWPSLLEAYDGAASYDAWG